MTIEMHHPALDRKITVQTEAQARIHERSGWKRVTEVDDADPDLVERFVEPDEKEE